MFFFFSNQTQSLKGQELKHCKHDQTGFHAVVSVITVKAFGNLKRQNHFRKNLCSPPPAGF